MGFILAINESVKGITNSSGSANVSESIEKLCNLLNELDKLIDETPPIDQPQRFGNQAFRIWYDKLKNGTFDYLQKMLPSALHHAIPEIMVYLIEGFGNSTRIDYGTGHEISFIMFLCCLFKIGYLQKSDQTAVACKVFVNYLDVVRKLQQTYRMEPAGSQGVWSLDDYQFVPFIWGSSQLSGPKRKNNHNLYYFANNLIFLAQLRLESTAFLETNIVERYHSENMFLSCIKYINQVKTGPFAEHSNQLWSISGVSSWTRINSGLIKMYKAEVRCFKFNFFQIVLMFLCFRCLVSSHWCNI